MEHLKNLDIIGYQINFLNESDIKFRTRIGGVASILFFFTYISLFIFLAMDDFNKLNPQSFFQENSLSGGFSINLTENSFIGGVEISGFNRKIENRDKIFKPIFSYNKFTQGEDGAKTIESFPMNSTTCDKIKLEEGLEAHSFNLSNYYCPILTNSNITLKGSFSSKELYYLRVEISNCDFDKKNCESFEEVSKAFKDNIIISVLYPQVSYDMKNYKQPLKLTLDSRFNYLNPKAFRFEEMYIGNYKVQDTTSEKLLFSNNFIHQHTGIERFKYVNDIRPTDYMGYDLPPAEVLNNIPITFYGLSFIMGSTEFFYDRKYKTFIDTLAQLSGLSTILYYIIVMIVEKIGKFYFNHYLFKKLIIYDKDPETNNEINFVRKLVNEFKVKNSNSNQRNAREKENPFPHLVPNQINSTENLNFNRRDNYLDAVDEEIKNEFIVRILDPSIIRKKKMEKEKENDQKNIELKKAKLILERELSKFEKDSNSMNISIFNFCFVNKRKKNVLIFNKFLKMIEKKFSFMTHLNLQYKMKIIKNILMKPIQRDISNLFSKKHFRLIETNGGDTKFLNMKDRNCIGAKEIVDYVTNENELDDFDKNFMGRIFNLYQQE